MRRAETKEQIEKNKVLNAQFLQAAGSFAEYIISLQPADKIMANVFGRDVRIKTASSLAYLHGLAVSGIRCAAMIEAEKINSSLQTLRAMARQHVPITLVVAKGALSKLPEIAQTGALVFQAFDAQSLSDRILMAQVVAEKNLLPVVVLAEFDEVLADVKFPSKKELNQFFGDPDNFSDVKSPAQGIVFGNKRKRVPSWLNANLPVHIGAIKDAKSQGLEIAANVAYSKKHIQGLIDETASEFEKMTSRKLQPFLVGGSEKVNHVIVSTSPVDKDVFANQSVSKNRVIFYSLQQLFPLPNFETKNWKGAASLTIIESFSEAQTGWLYKEIATDNQFNNVEKHNGWYANTVDEKGWNAILQNVLLGNKGVQKFWVDIAFDVEKSSFPKHQVLAQRIAREYPELMSKSLVKAKTEGRENNLVNPGMAVKKYAEKGPAFTRVARFYDDTACFYGNAANELIADPFQEFATMPVATASFMPQHRGWAPEFLPEKCQDIESILKACPHGALPASLLTIDAIIKAGIQQARTKGYAIGALVPLLKIWAKNATDIAIKDGKNITIINDFLPAAFELTLKVSKADAEKEATLRQEFVWTMESIADVPVALTETYFLQAEKAKPTSGEVFTLAVNPYACTGCGSCAELCTDGSMKMHTELAKIEALNAKRFAQFAGLPNTSEATISALIADKDFDSFAALMLDREFYEAFVGGSKNDELTAEKSLIRMISALAKHTLQPNFDELDKLLSKQNAALNAAVKKILSDSLPVTHLDSLMEVLQTSREEKLSMDLIMKEWGQQDAFKVVEKENLQSKLELIEALKEWKWALKEGFTGAGRANYSVVIDQSLSGFSQYPWNNFTVPVLLAEKGETAHIVLGAFEGQLRHAIDQIKLLRRTDLEAIGKYDASVHDFQIAGLTWPQLTEKEKKLVPPVLVLATEEIFADFASASINQLLESGYPIKLFVFDNLNAKPENGVAKITANTNAIWPLLANGSAYISRVSLMDANHMFVEMQGALTSLSGAVVSVLCPNTYAHDINPQRWRSLSNLAVNTRSFNPFSFNPLAEANTFGKKINTAAIPNIEADWQEVELKHIENDEEVTLKYKPTWADWAFTLHTWKAQFKLLENAENALVVSDYIALAAGDRAKKVPVILRLNDENKLLRYAAGDCVIATTEATLRSFRLLRELAGLYSEFPEQLKEKVTAELSGAFEAEKKKLTAELAKEKAGWEADNLLKIKAQIKERLMQMAQEQ